MKNLPAIVVQGPSNSIEGHKLAWKGFQIIFSTWKDQESNYEPSDVVVYNDMPEDSGPGNYNLQKITTLSGLMKAKELGFEHAIKIRQDLFPTDSLKFCSLLSESKFNFLCWYAHKDIHPKFKGYLVDYIMSGPIDMMINLWNNTEWNYSVSELILTHRFFNFFNELDTCYFLDKLDASNDLFWNKYKIHLSTYSQHEGFKISQEHLIL